MPSRTGIPSAKRASPQRLAGGGMPRRQPGPRLPTERCPPPCEGCRMVRTSWRRRPRRAGGTGIVLIFTISKEPSRSPENLPVVALDRLPARLLRGHRHHGRQAELSPWHRVGEDLLPPSPRGAEPASASGTPCRGATPGPQLADAATRRGREGGEGPRRALVYHDAHGFGRTRLVPPGDRMGDAQVVLRQLRECLGAERR